MTKSLPSHANLEWLKKHAKQRKKTFSAHNGAEKLSDVQFQIAKDYGFASWRSLKAYFDQRDGLGSSAIDSGSATKFLSNVAENQIDVVKKALQHSPSLANCIAGHPFWGGRLQPLHLAIEGNKPGMFELLLAKGSSVNGLNAEYDFWSPLMLALFHERGSMVAELRKRGANYGLCEILLAGDDEHLDTLLDDKKNHETPRPSGSLFAFARTPHAISLLLEVGFAITDKDRWGSDGMDALSRLGQAGWPLVEVMQTHGHVAQAKDVARLGDLNGLKLLAEKTDQTFADEVMMAAVDFGHCEIVAWLLENGASADVRYAFGSKGTALHSAAWNGDAPMVELLLSHGAKPDALDEEFKTTPLIWAQRARVVTNNARCDATANILSRI